MPSEFKGYTAFILYDMLDPGLASKSFATNRINYS